MTQPVVQPVVAPTVAQAVSQPVAAPNAAPAIAPAVVSESTVAIATPAAENPTLVQPEVVRTEDQLQVDAPQPAPATSSTPVPAFASGAARIDREEASLYAALPQQLRQANVAMLANLHQRVGGAMQGDDRLGQRQAWGRMINTERNLRQQGGVSPASKGRLTGFQTGTDLWADADSRAGLYVGQLEGNMAVTGDVNGVQGAAAGSNQLRHQYLAAYFTWQAETGAYADVVLQAGRHRHTAKGLTSAASSGKGESRLASLELGKSFASGTHWRIEPQLQLAYQQLRFDDVALGAAQVHLDSRSGWLARAGVRVHSHLETRAGSFQPFARLNLYKTGSGSDRLRWTGSAATTQLHAPTGGESLEMAAGGNWQLSPRTSLYGEAGKLWGRGASQASSGVNLTVGLKVRW